MRFTFEGDRTFAGVTDDTRWNGFLNVRVAPKVRDEIVEWLRGVNDDEEQISDLAAIALDGDGLVSLAGGYATQEVTACLECGAPDADLDDAGRCKGGCRCGDCDEPIEYDKARERWRHVNHKAPPCFLQPLTEMCDGCGARGVHPYPIFGGWAFACNDCKRKAESLAASCTIPASEREPLNDDQGATPQEWAEWARYAFGEVKP